MAEVITTRYEIKSHRENGEIQLSWNGPEDQQGFAYRSPRGERYELRFEIAPNEFGLQFYPDPKQAFWVRKGSAPHQPSSEEDFIPQSVSDDGLTLIVVNENHNPANYFFSLSFKSDDGAIRYVSGTATDRQ